MGKSIARVVWGCEQTAEQSYTGEGWRENGGALAMHQ